MKRLVQVLGVVAALAVAHLLLVQFVWAPGELGAADARKLKVLCNACTTTGAQTTQVLSRIGGWATYQVTCLAAGGPTWPDTVTLQARDSDDHTWVTVKGHTASTADEREGVFWFARGSEVRINIADAAGTRSCIASLAFGQSGDY